MNLFPRQYLKPGKLEEDAICKHLDLGSQREMRERACSQYPFLDSKPCLSASQSVSMPLSSPLDTLSFCTLFLARLRIGDI